MIKAILAVFLVVAQTSISTVISTFVVPATSGETAVAPPADAREFATKVAFTNDLAVQASLLAGAKSTRNDVKQFAQKIINDHAVSNAGLSDAISALDLDPMTKANKGSDSIIGRLEAAGPREFDRLFAITEVALQEAVVAMLDNYAETGDQSEMLSFVDAVLPTHRHDLELANQLLSTLTTSAALIE